MYPGNLRCITWQNTDRAVEQTTLVHPELGRINGKSLSDLCIAQEEQHVLLIKT